LCSHDLLQAVVCRVAGGEPGLAANVNTGQGVKQSKNIQQPQNDGDDYHAVQDGLDLSLHGDEAIHQPQEDTYYDQNFEELN
jgi:hypothetical protein